MTTSLGFRVGLGVAILFWGGSLGAQQFIRGDVNADAVLDVSDPIVTLTNLFDDPVIAPILCEDAADGNDDGIVDLADPVFVLSAIFGGSVTIPAPFPECGIDPTDPDGLGCDSFDPCPGLEPGTFPADWIHGSPNCASNNDPPLQVHAYNPNTYILRQNMCINFEGPFLYLFIGEDTALLLDTGATSNPSVFPVQATVQGILDDWIQTTGQPSIDLVVAHTHGHGDHVQGDSQFVGQANTTVVGTSLSSVTNFFGISNWPEQAVTFELGARTIDILPIPGHQTSHLAFYDQNTGLLVTGDSLYPGYIFVSGSNWDTYADSIARLVDFCSTHPVAHILGTHVEMTDEPGVAYPYGATYQPDERDLPLTIDHLLELNAAMQSLPGPSFDVHDDFIIWGS